MATYVIGDLQGCMSTCEALLRRIEHDPARDQLWLAGDLVNRGPRSLDALRWARRAASRVVLGNHDLHLLAVAAGLRRARKKDTLGPILSAPDRPELLEWLRRQPLLVREGGAVMIHAGLLPEWTLDEAQAQAEAISGELSGPRWRGLLERYFDKQERARDPALAALEVLTTLRTLDASGRPLASFKGPPAERPAGSEPWFSAPGRRWAGQERVFFGHWAALDFHETPDAVGLDSGCVWGKSLSAYRLEDGVRFREPARD